MKKSLFFSLCIAFLAFASCDKSELPEPEARSVPSSDFALGKYASVGVKINGVNVTDYYKVTFTIHLDSVRYKSGKVAAYSLPALFLTKEVHPVLGTTVRDSIKSTANEFSIDYLFGDKIYQMGEYYEEPGNCSECSSTIRFRVKVAFRYEKNADSSLTFTRLVNGVKHEYRLAKQ